MAKKKDKSLFLSHAKVHLGCLGLRDPAVRDQAPPFAFLFCKRPQPLGQNSTICVSSVRQKKGEEAASMEATAYNTTFMPIATSACKVGWEMETNAGYLIQADLQQIQSLTLQRIALH